jgi:hypothetical protein
MRANLPYRKTFGTSTIASPLKPTGERTRQGAMHASIEEMDSTCLDEAQQTD